MSTYTKQTKHPVTGEWEEAQWIDDLFGKHHYGVVFPSDYQELKATYGEDSEEYYINRKVAYDPEKVGLETRETEADVVRKANDNFSERVETFAFEYNDVQIKKQSTRYTLSDGDGTIEAEVSDGRISINGLILINRYPEELQAIGKLITEAGKLGDK